MSSARERPETVTLGNVSTLSTFELRQECEARNATLPKQINHTTLLQTLVRVLLDERADAERRECERLDQERADLRERLEREKTARKAAAVERSRQRQLAAAAVQQAQETVGAQNQCTEHHQAPAAAAQ